MGQIVADRQGERRREPFITLCLLERRGMALEDPLSVLRYVEAAQHGLYDAVIAEGGGTEQPGLLPQLGRSGLDLGEGMLRPRHEDDLIVQKRSMGHGVGETSRLRADRHVNGPGGEESLELLGVAHAQLDVEIVRPAGKQLDEARSGSFGEQTRRREAEQPTPVPGLSHFPYGAVLQAEQLGRAGGETQAPRGEGESGSCPREQLVVEFFSKLADVKRHGRLAHSELGRGLFDRAVPHDCGKGTELGLGHSAGMIPAHHEVSRATCCGRPGERVLEGLGR